MDENELDEILNSYSWIKVKKLKVDGLTLDEKYDSLMKHHIEETTFLINKVKELAKIIKELK